MKKINFIKPLMLALLAFSSCDDDLLEKSNPSQFLMDQYFESESQLQASVNAVYSALQASDLYGREYFFLHDLLADENVPTAGLEAHRGQLLNHDIDASNAILATTWRGFYRVIHRANLVIANADQVPEIEISEESRKRLVAEAKFLRAWSYFELVSLWGDVPLMTEPAPPGTTEGRSRTAESEVYKLIFEDLAYAKQHLGEKSSYSSGDLGRVTKGAALALAGKIHLFRGNYAEARTELQKVINSGEYSLTNRYLDNFEEENENNIESIFEVQFSMDYGYGNPWSADGNGIDEVTFRGQEYAPVTGWTNVNPREDLVAAFEEEDPRVKYNFYHNGDTYDNNSKVMDINRPGWKKYSNAYKQGGENQISGINFRVIRYADVLLMMAEAENEVGTIDKAIGYVNQVRAREDVNMPALDAPADKNAMLGIIMQERRVEFAGEQIRNRDLRRWRREGKLVSETIANWQSKHALLPIPVQEFDNNDAISTNNPGY